MNARSGHRLRPLAMRSPARWRSTRPGDRCPRAAGVPGATSCTVWKQGARSRVHRAIVLGRSGSDGSGRLVDQAIPSNSVRQRSPDPSSGRRGHRSPPTAPTRARDGPDQPRARPRSPGPGHRSSCPDTSSPPACWRDPCVASTPGYSTTTPSDGSPAQRHARSFGDTGHLLERDLSRRSRRSDRRRSRWVIRPFGKSVLCRGGCWNGSVRTSRGLQPKLSRVVLFRDVTRRAVPPGVE